MEHHATSRVLDEELESFIGDWLPDDWSIVVKIKMQSKADESMIITQQIVVFVKSLGHEIAFEVGESLFAPVWSPEMWKIQLISRAGMPEVYVKDLK